MKWIRALLCAGGLWSAAAWAQSPVTINVAPQPTGPLIPDNFVGLSFGMRALLPDSAGEHFFNAANKPLVTVFQNVGLHHLRVGGTTVEAPPATPIPDEPEIDSLFGFAHAAGVEGITYSLRLLETNADLHYERTDARLARYIWDHDRTNLDCFAIGNEPDLQRVYKQDVSIRNFSSYMKEWKRFAAAISHAAPDASLAGPDAGSGNGHWTTNFLAHTRDIAALKMITGHYYAGGAGRGVTPAHGIETMLSSNWLSNYQRLFQKMAQPVLDAHLAFRFTEANDHYSGGIADASDTFAGALWALDFLHWWAAHGIQGVDFHNTTWVSSDVIVLDSNNQATVAPKAYGLKAFNLGSAGRVTDVRITNPDGANLTAYAVRGTGALYVTIINKEYGPHARDLAVTINAAGIGSKAEAMHLHAAKNAEAKAGVPLGGGEISGDAPWTGHWQELTTVQPGHCAINVPATSAVILKVLTH